MGRTWLQHFQALQRCQCWRSQWLRHQPSAPGGEKQSREIAHPSLLCVFGDLLKTVEQTGTAEEGLPLYEGKCLHSPSPSPSKYKMSHQDPLESQPRHWEVEAK